MKIQAWTTTVALTALLLVPTAAHAQAGSPAPQAFDDTVPRVFIAQAPHAASQVQFLAAVQNASGSATFASEFSVGKLRLNAIAFNPLDRFVYGYVQNSVDAAIPAGSIVKVGKNGAVSRVGTHTFRDGEGATLLNAGEIDGSGHYYLHRSDSGSRSVTIERVNLSTGTSQGITNFSAPGVTGVSDFAMVDGVLVGLGADGRFARFNLSTATVSYFAAPAEMPRGVYGGAWVYGNGNLGLSLNSGGIYQVNVTNAATDAAFTLVSAVDGPGSHNNDGTSIPAAPVDLGVSETVALDATDPARVNYTVTVTNHGVGISSGHTVTGPLGADLASVSSADSACSTGAAGLSCTSGVLAVGETRSYNFSGGVAAPVALRTVSHTVTVLGNELDPVAANDVASTVVVTPPAPPVADEPPMSDEPQAPEAPQVPEVPEVPEAPQAPEVPEVPEAPQAPEVPEVPQAPQAPEVPEVPEAPQAPEVPEVPQAPEVPAEDNTPAEQPIPTVPVVTLPGLDGPLVTEPVPAEGATPESELPAIVLPGLDGPLVAAPTPAESGAPLAEAVPVAETQLAATGGNAFAALAGTVMLVLGAVLLYLRRRLSRSE